MRIIIHQPEHFPWLGFFHKIQMADTFVVLDNVQFRKNYFQNRNKIKTAVGWSWITVPVKNSFGQKISEILIDPSNEVWKKKYWNAIYLSYRKAPFFEKYAEIFKDILNKQWIYICDLNIEFIKAIFQILGLEPKIIKASDMEVQGKSSDLLLDICKQVKAQVCVFGVSGIAGQGKRAEEEFSKNGVEIICDEFYHPIYKQLSEPFIPCMSVIDLLFNHGDKTLDIINGVDVPVMKEVFL